MTDWKVQKTIDYLANLNVGLPDSDWDDFLSRKSAHDLAVKRGRRFLTVVISVPAAAAVLLLMFLLPINRTPADQTAQNNLEPPQEELQVLTDSISSPDDSVILGGVLAEPTLVENKVAMTSAVTTVRMSNDTVYFNQDTYRQQLDSMLVRNNKTKEELDSITADMMERVTAYEQNKAPTNPNMTFGGFGGFGGAMQIHNATYSILEKEQPYSSAQTDTITFHIEDLAPRSQELPLEPANKIALRLLNSHISAKQEVERRTTQGKGPLLQNNGAVIRNDHDIYELIMTSFQGESLFTNDFNSVSKGLMWAFADHRPVVFSPDMIWLLITQAFGHYVNNNAEQMRPLLVSHDDIKTLTVVSEHDLLNEPDQVDWQEIMDAFESQIDYYTKNDVAGLIVADFSTTGPTEKIASQITLMEAVKSFFEYRVMYSVCGIPDVTLIGTPDDWRKVREKASKLKDFGLDWWVNDLDPILEQFVRASEGDVDVQFWKDMVKKLRPGEVRMASCSPYDNTITKFDGWFLKFYPFDMEGRTPREIEYHHPMLPEVVKTPFKYIVTDIDGTTLKEYNMELWAGFFGMTQDPVNGALTPKIGWMVSRIITPDDVYEEYADKNNRHETIVIKTNYEIPAVLARFDHIYSLEFDFGRTIWNLPQWFKDIKIDRLKIKGSVFDSYDEKRLEQLRKNYPNAILEITDLRPE